MLCFALRISQASGILAVPFLRISFVHFIACVLSVNFSLKTTGCAIIFFFDTFVLNAFKAISEFGRDTINIEIEKQERSTWN